MPYSYTDLQLDLESIRNWLKIDHQDYDDVLIDLTVRMQAWVGHQAGRYFGPVAPHSEVLSGRDYSEIWLNDVPIKGHTVPIKVVVSLTTLVVGDTTSTLFEDTDFTVDGRRLIRKNWIWPWGENNLTVEYHRGYEAGKLPPDIEQLILDLIAKKWRGRGYEHISSRKVGDIQLSHRVDLRELSYEQQATLAAWRRAR